MTDITCNPKIRERRIEMNFNHRNKNSNLIGFIWRARTRWDSSRRAGRIISFHRFRSAQEGRISIRRELRRNVPRRSAFCKNENLRNAPRILFLDLGIAYKNITRGFTSRPRIKVDCLGITSERNFDIGAEMRLSFGRKE